VVNLAPNELFPKEGLGLGLGQGLELRTLKLGLPLGQVDCKPMNLFNI